IVPASTLMYGSIFWSVTRKPRASRSDPIDAAARPLPSDDTTPPVTKMNFGAKSSSFRYPVSDQILFRGPVGDETVQPPVPELGERPRHRGAPRDAECDDVLGTERAGRAIESHEPLDDLPHRGRPSAGSRHLEPEPRQVHESPFAQQACAFARPRGVEERARQGVRSLERHVDPGPRAALQIGR